MMLVHPIAAAAVLVALSASVAAAAPCPPPDGRPETASRRGGQDCQPPKLEPYDPDRVRAGTRPGFIDLGGGTEVQVGGRARAEFTNRR